MPTVSAASEVQSRTSGFRQAQTPVSIYSEENDQEEGDAKGEVVMIALSSLIAEPIKVMNQSSLIIVDISALAVGTSSGHLGRHRPHLAIIMLIMLSAQAQE